MRGLNANVCAVVDVGLSRHDAVRVCRDSISVLGDTDLRQSKRVQDG